MIRVWEENEMREASLTCCQVLRHVHYKKTYSRLKSKR